MAVVGIDNVAALRLARSLGARRMHMDSDAIEYLLPARASGRPGPQPMATP
jgi:hypothetical protein